MSDYLRQYGFILVLTSVAIIVPASVLLLSHFASKFRIRPQRPNPFKLDPYECGMETIGEPRWERFNVRYYRYALMFVLIGAVLVFIVMMVVGWAYEWARGGMEWDDSGAKPQSSGRIIT